MTSKQRAKEIMNEVMYPYGKDVNVPERVFLNKAVDFKPLDIDDYAYIQSATESHIFE